MATKNAADYLAENKAEILEAMKAIGAARATVTYSGSGDEGQFDQPEFVKADGTAINAEEAMVNLKATVGVWVSGESKWENKEWEGEVDLNEALSDLCHDLVQDRHGGWENNEGGCGSLQVLVEGGKFRLEHSNYYIETEYSEYDL